MGFCGSQILRVEGVWEPFWCHSVPLAIIYEPEPINVNQGGSRRPNQFGVPLGDRKKVHAEMKGCLLYKKEKKINKIKTSYIFNSFFQIKKKNGNFTWSIGSLCEVC